MKVHEAALIFPLDEEHIEELARDIAKNGLMTPIETLDGKILDGRRRFAACTKAKVKPEFRAVFTEDPVAHVLSLNLHRRHLSPTQLGMVAGRARKFYDDAAKERMSEGGKAAGKGRPQQGVENLPHPNDQSGKARDAVGKAVGVSGRTVDMATRVLNKGTPELIAAVDADLIAVSSAERIVGMSEKEQKEHIDRAKERQANGQKPKPRPAVERDKAEDIEPDGKLKGKGVILANEAVNCLIRIPKNDALRKRGFQIVTDWIKANK